MHNRIRIDIQDLPPSIQTQILKISEEIELIKRSRKASNGYIFFGKNVITNSPVALKIYYWNGQDEYHAEPNNLAKIDSENVIRILHASRIDNDYAYFLTPHYKDGDLDDELSKGINNARNAVIMSEGILSGLGFLHSNHLLHRDLKPSNIYLSEGAPLIGDFGSVKKIPEGHTAIPGSGHSLLYTPPESISANLYGIPGDIYQIGLILYQLLGGSLPYEQCSWLNKRELKEFYSYLNPVDQQVFANEKIKSRIKQGKIVNLSTLPIWVPNTLKIIIAKACNVDPEKRFQSTSEFLCRLGRVKNTIHDWKYIDGYLTLEGKKVSYRIIDASSKNLYFVQKNKNAGWRKDPSFGQDSASNLVRAVEFVLRKQ